MSCRHAVRALVLAFAVASAPTVAFAQRNDAAYCAALSDLASRYLVGDTARGHSKPDLDTAIAIEDCRRGNTAAGIPVLERKLRNAGFTLPPRS